MKNELFIELDDYPIEYNPQLCHDYNGLFVSQFLYSSLIDGNNCNIVSEDNTQFEIELYDSLLSRNIFSDSYIRALIYYYNNPTQFSVFRPFIKTKEGTPEIFEINKRKFKINLKIQFPEFKSLLQSRYIIPLDENYRPLFSGDYRLIVGDSHDQLSLKKVASTAPFERIVFVVNSDSIKTIRLLNTGSIDMTCPSNYSPLLDYIDNFNRKQQDGSLIYYLFVKNERILKCLQKNKSYILNRVSRTLGRYLDPIDSFWIQKYRPDKSVEKIESCSTKEECTFVYSDFFPNKLLATICADVLNMCGYSVNLKKEVSFRTYMETRNLYDGYIGVRYPKYDSLTSYALSFAVQLNADKKKEFLNCFMVRNFDGMHRVLQDVPRFFPLAISKTIYLFNDHAKNIEISRFGKITFHTN